MWKGWLQPPELLRMIQISGTARLGFAADTLPSKNSPLIDQAPLSRLSSNSRVRLTRLRSIGADMAAVQMGRGLRHPEPDMLVHRREIVEDAREHGIAVARVDRRAKKCIGGKSSSWVS